MDAITLAEESLRAAGIDFVPVHGTASIVAAIDCPICAGDVSCAA